MPLYAIYDPCDGSAPNKDLDRPLRIVGPDEFAAMTADELRSAIARAWSLGIFLCRQRDGTAIVYCRDVPEYGHFDFVWGETEALAAKHYEDKLRLAKERYAEWLAKNDAA
jgi:hypothetical protein